MRRLPIPLHYREVLETLLPPPAPQQGPPQSPPYVPGVFPAGRGGRAPGAHLPAGGPASLTRALPGAPRAGARAKLRGPAALGHISALRVPAHTQPRSSTGLTYPPPPPPGPATAAARRAGLVQGPRRRQEAGPARPRPPPAPWEEGQGAGGVGATRPSGRWTCGPSWDGPRWDSGAP